MILIEGPIVEDRNPSDVFVGAPGQKKGRLGVLVEWVIGWVQLGSGVNHDRRHPQRVSPIKSEREMQKSTDITSVADIHGVNAQHGCLGRMFDPL
jgi:hypothetical protein